MPTPHCETCEKVDSCVVTENVFKNMTRDQQETYGVCPAKCPLLPVGFDETVTMLVDSFGGGFIIMPTSYEDESTHPGIFPNNGDDFGAVWFEMRNGKVVFVDNH